MRKVLVLFFVFIVSTSTASAQFGLPGNPPRPITVKVDPLQGLSFGAFYLGNNGGNVIVAPNGSRSVSGSIIPVNQGFSFSPAIFQITAEPGTIITLVNGPDVMLSGSNGGKINLHIGNSDLGNQFITSATSSSPTLLRVGGTLTLDNTLANPPGNYNGIFSIIFIQQ